MSSRPRTRRIDVGRLIEMACVALGVFVGLVPRPAPADQPDACVGRVGELHGGRIIVIQREPAGGRGVALHACGMVDAPPAKVWPVVRDCEKYEQFMPGVERSKLQSRSGNTAICDVVVDLPFPLGELRSVTNIVETERPDGGFFRRSTLLHGSYRHNDGSWTLLPRDDGSTTLVAYDIDFDPKTMIPDFVLRQVQSVKAPEIFEAIRERVRVCKNSTQSCGEK